MFIFCTIGDFRDLKLCFYFILCVKYPLFNFPNLWPYLCHFKINGEKSLSFVFSWYDYYYSPTLNASLVSHYWGRWVREITHLRAKAVDHLYPPVQLQNNRLLKTLLPAGWKVINDSNNTASLKGSFVVGRGNWIIKDGLWGYF